MFKKLLGSVFGGGQQVDAVPNFHERRKAVRRACDVQVEGSCGRQRFSLTIVDLSAAGLLFSCSTQVKLKPKARVRVTNPESLTDHTADLIDCTVVWRRTREADQVQFVGAEFSEPKALGSTWVKGEMEDIGFRGHNLREQRKLCRVAYQAAGTVHLPGGQTACKVLNIGLGGVLIEVQKPLRAGAAVVVELPDTAALPGSSYKATVRHLQHADPSSPFCHGLAFQGLSAEQEQNLKALMVERRRLAWENPGEVDDSGEFEEAPGPALSDEEFEAEKAAILAELAAEDEPQSDSDEAAG